MATTTSIDIDFEKLDQNISALRSLLAKMDEPSYDQVTFWLNGTSGSGMVLDHLQGFCNNTIDFYKNVYALIEKTIGYLESIKKLKNADQKIAETL